MVRRPNNFQMQDERGAQTYRRPIWLPAPAYYILMVAVAVALFFLSWGLLHEEIDDSPWIPAGLIASFFLIAAVIVREIFLRRAQRRFVMAQKRLDYNLNSVRHVTAEHPNKLTLEKNSRIIREIVEKSEAAKVLGKLSDAHLDVFELCNQYLHLTEKELQTVGVGSPRIAALRRGREVVSELHRFHLLTWASLESRHLTHEAQVRATMAEKLETAQKALLVLESAMQYYPVERELIESSEVVKEFISSIKVSHWIEQAERSANKGHHKRAVSHYRDALFYLGRENARNEQSDLIAEKINGEIEKLRTLTENKIIQRKLEK